MSVEFEDYSAKVKSMLDDAVISYLYEAAGEVQGQALRNTRVDTGKTKGSWQYAVDEDKKEATIGSMLENAIWEEFGTGEYAVNGNGRKGGWWIEVGEGKNQISQAVADRYEWARVKKDKNDRITAVFTYGKKPTRALQKAFTSKKEMLKGLAENTIKKELKWNDK